MTGTGAASGAGFPRVAGPGDRGPAGGGAAGFGRAGADRGPAGFGGTPAGGSDFGDARGTAGVPDFGGTRTPSGGSSGGAFGGARIAAITPGAAGVPEGAAAGSRGVGAPGALTTSASSSGPAASPAAGAGGGSGAVGYRGPTACSAAGITYRQLDYWARTGLVEPSVRSASGSGSQRLYSFRDIIALKIVKRLLDTGVSLQNIRIAVGYLRARGDADLAGVTLMSDGASVYECTSPTEVFDLVQGGQGVFGIAVDAVCREVEGTLRQFPVERLGWGGDDAGAPASEPDQTGAVIDELARRRRIRAV